MEIQYKCAKCLGTDYYMSTRNVTSGYGWGIRGKMKDFPVCRQCDEIMHFISNKSPQSGSKAIRPIALAVITWAIIMLIVFIVI